MGCISGRKLNQILGNLEKIFAIELMFAAQAIDLRRPNRCSDIMESNHAIIRDKVDKLEQDRLLKPDIDAMVQLVSQRTFITQLPSLSA